MRLPSLLRDAVMLTVAGAIGWWAHGTAVHAAPQPPLELGFQFQNPTTESNLTLYNPGNHTVYIYPTHGSSNSIGCSASFRIGNPGEAIERTNCPVAPLTSH